MHRADNRFDHLPCWSGEIENPGEIQRLKRMAQHRRLTGQARTVCSNCARIIQVSGVAVSGACSSPVRIVCIPGTLRLSMLFWDFDEVSTFTSRTPRTVFVLAGETSGQIRSRLSSALLSGPEPDQADLEAHPEAMCAQPVLPEAGWGHR